MNLVVFFKQKTAYELRISDWSSDVCSSDLHDIEVVVDRLVVKEGIGTRLADSFETALKLADGLAYVDLVDASVAEALQSPSPSGEGLGWGSTASPEEIGRAHV